MLKKLIKLIALFSLAQFLVTVGAENLFAQDWVVADSQVVENQSILLNGNLLVGSGGSLTLRGVTLTINNSHNGEYGIWVKSEGAITIEAGSVITAASDLARLRFTVDQKANFVMRNSELRRCGWNVFPSYPYEPGGLRVYGDNPVIENNTFSENAIAIQLLYGSGGRIAGNRFLNSPSTRAHIGMVGWMGATIVDNFFSTNPFYGVAVEFASHNNIIRNNTFDHNMHGAINTIRAWGNEFSGNQVLGGAGPYLNHRSGNNRIIDNVFTGPEGVTIFHSTKNTIQGNTFTNSTHWNILLGYASDNLVANNTISNNIAVSAQASIELYHASTNTLINNRISPVKINDEELIGILVRGSSNNNVIQSNEIYSARRGISLHYSANGNTVAFNAVNSSSQQGIVIESSSDNPN